MTIWVDAHLSPAIANWITDTFGVEAVALRDLGLREDPDFATVIKLLQTLGFRWQVVTA